jgi:hypothetical protein
MPPVSRRRPPAPASVQTYTVPAPIGGLNTVSAGLQLPPSDCVLAFNLIASESGLRARLGYREWITGLTGITDDNVRSIIPFSGGASGSGRLFVTTETGIWDATATTATPTQVFSFATQTGRAGYGVSSVFVTTAGYFILYADEVNGLHIYAEAGGAWSAVTQGGGASQIDGIAPSRFVFVAVFKGRVWFVERDSPNAWYLPTGQVFGTASKFPLGGVFRSGGTLVGLWNWTYDGGAGLDDSLVAVSTGGDVAVYQGTDPSSASSFGLRGVWQIGDTPGGRRIGTSLGGDLLLLSRQGLAPMSRLVVGATGEMEYATAKIANILNRLMLTKANEITWTVVQNPEDNALMLVIPRAGDTDDLQLVQAQASRGWFPYRGLPMLSAGVWKGQLWFGTEDGRLCLHSGFVDDVRLSDGSFGPVSWSLITAPTNLDSPRQKRVGMIRPLIIAESAGSSFQAQARYRYDLTELDPVALVIDGGSGTWDTAIWDVDVWGGATLPTQEFRGGVGVGVEVAIALRGSSISRCVLVSTDVMFQAGGYM